MMDCEVKVLHLLNSENKTEDQYHTFCEDLKNGSDCPLHLPEDCKKRYPSASAQYTLVFDQMEEWCFGLSGSREGFCYFEHQREIGKCYEFLTKRMIENPNQTACDSYEFFNCMHGQVLQYCVNGPNVLANFLEGVIQSYPEYCRGCVDKSSIYWILDLLSFFSLVLFQKIWN
ncbi:hypothetical protein AVEN_213362-2 [Araneus ventricosus]|uniref:Uncharacterized protein n=1 Tax=Araneus ventricosus TaxID=182803 RepID=A0A4Y2G285_ARAVE|nr:hypothetical protein AVEN_213362-2 [Araneus ventricosus]